MGDHFFSERNENFRQLIEAARESTSIGVLFGAGVSQDAGAPTWSQLVEGLLVKALRLSAEDDDSLTDRMLREEATSLIARIGLSGAATSARAILGEDRTGHVRDLLFRNKPVPAQFHSALLALSVGYDRRLLVTTNYDDLHEQGARRLGLTYGSLVPNQNERLGSSDVWSPKHDAKDGSVWHIHGLIPETDAASDLVVLDEIDYAKLGEASFDVLNALSEAGLTLVLGMSLSDPTVVKAFAKGAHSQSFFVRTPPPEGLSTHQVNFEEYRCKQLNLIPVYCKSFGQIPQLLYEMALSRTSTQLDRPVRRTANELASCAWQGRSILVSRHRGAHSESVGRTNRDDQERANAERR